MSKLTKEEVISQLEGFLTSQQGKTVSIEQKGSWYKIDGGKSLRFSELESMFAEFNTETGTQKADTPTTVQTSSPTAAKVKTVKVAHTQTTTKTSGQTPKELWRQKLAGQGQLPRGF
ncbi:hypothetical protein [uncultured Shewanella sp.]|uniref:hypothetical protein n=1 Tax=uncultured Shewanella sp. TaxID=173975 RepID=UPI002631B02B|nr:hypothetical protein [uncultured Shewanella sp.]